MKATIAGLALVVLSLPAAAQDGRSRPVRDGGVPGPEATEVPAPEIADDQITTAERDGHWVTSVRFASPGATGLQLLIQDLLLPTGATLTISETSGVARGVYTGSGPTGGGDFWSDAVHGSEAILDVVYDTDVAGGLPFHVAALRRLTQADLDQLERRDVGVYRSALAAAPLSYEIREGLAIVEGDIQIGAADEVERKGGRESIGITGSSYRWPGGVIPYLIDPALPNQTRIISAINHWNTSLAGAIRLVPRTTEAYYARFTNSADPGLCSSYIGNTRSAGQKIMIGAYCSTGNVVHEIGHTVGLFHEHTREDRNRFVQILYQNITPAAVPNFDQVIPYSDDLGAYDYNSIMHYPANAFSSNGQLTIVTIPAGIPIGQRNTLSPGDIAGARSMYTSAPPPPPTTVAVTIASNPSGRNVVIDGTTVTTPRVFQWTPGGVHSVSAPSATVGNTRYNFSSWSNGGPQTHNILVPSGAASLTANFAVQHKVTVTSSNTALGTVAISPASSDSFYSQGSTVNLTATGTAAGCLANWTGIAAPASSPLRVSVTQPYAITANFQTGAVTASSTWFLLPWTGGSVTLTITASTGCRWTAVPTSWITVTPSTGTGTRVVTITVPRRDATTSRTGTIQLGNVTIRVTQLRH